jgi:hypothetical protein
VLNELLPNEPGSDTTAKLTFIELRGEPDLLVDGAQLQLVNGADGAVYDRITLLGSTDTNGLFVVAESDVTIATQIANVNLQNGPDAVWLIDRDGGVIDSVSYGESGVAAEGRAAAIPAEGRSLARRDTPELAACDSDDNQADFCDTEPSPGAVNTDCSSPALP